MKKTYQYVIACLCILLCLSCKHRRHSYIDYPDENQIETSSEISNTPKTSFKENESDQNEQKSCPEETIDYSNISLKTGDVPYKCTNTTGSNSTISVKTSSTSPSDVVVIIKRNGKIARDAYIKAGGTYTFKLPSGTYQVFFYGGTGWNPSKEMPGGMKGGFVSMESFSKDDPVSLNHNSLQYELILQPNGNFSTKPSAPSEVF